MIEVELMTARTKHQSPSGRRHTAQANQHRRSRRTCSQTQGNATFGDRATQLPGRRVPSLNPNFTLTIATRNALADASASPARAAEPDAVRRRSPSGGGAGPGPSIAPSLAERRYRVTVSARPGGAAVGNAQPVNPPERRA